MRQIDVAAPYTKRHIEMKQFRIRHCLIITSLFCVGLSLWLTIVQPIRDLQNAGVFLAKSEGFTVSAHGDIQLDGHHHVGILDLHNIEGAFYSKGSFTNEHTVQHLSSLPNLKFVSLSRKTILPKDIDVLLNLPQLYYLSLDNAQIKSSDLVRLSQNGSLKVLDIGGVECTSAALEKIRRDRPDIKILRGWH